jgi:hypothetical protein
VREVMRKKILLLLSLLLLRMVCSTRLTIKF